MSRKKSVNDFSKLHELVPGAEPPPAEPMVSKSHLDAMVTLKVRFEKKGRRGKGVTVVSGFHHTREDLESLARKLKSTCGAGGTVKNETIEIQGDHREKVKALLADMGFNVGK